MPPPYPAGRGFNTQPPEGGWLLNLRSRSKSTLFQHTAARRRLVGDLELDVAVLEFQHTAARRRLEAKSVIGYIKNQVSTHSRPKAAGRPVAKPTARSPVSTHSRPKAAGFRKSKAVDVFDVSTHSRPKAAGVRKQGCDGRRWSFNTQPPEGGWVAMANFLIPFEVSTHSRPKAAGHEPCRIGGQYVQFQHTAARRRLDYYKELCRLYGVFQHTAARRRLADGYNDPAHQLRFQHTAARRRLAGLMPCRLSVDFVSTHSRPKAAGTRLAPEILPELKFQHTAARRRLACRMCSYSTRHGFNTQPPEGGWES